MPKPAHPRRIALAVIVVVLFLAITQIWPVPANSTTGQMHAVSVFMPQLPDPSEPMQPGQTFTLIWQPQRVSGKQVSNSSPVNCSAALLGPFSSQDMAWGAADALGRVDGLPVPYSTTTTQPTMIPLTLEWPSLTLDDRSGMSRSSQFTLPPSLTPGYYVLDARAIGTEGSSIGDEVIVIEAASA